MIEFIVLGIIQGVAEWLPISSEGAIVLVERLVFHVDLPTEDLIHIALFLHIGTLVAAIVYMRKDVLRVLRTVVRWKESEQGDRKIFLFLLGTTLISGGLGFAVLEGLSFAESKFMIFSKLIMVLIGLFLAGTGVLQLRAKAEGTRSEAHLSWKDTMVLGIAQGLTVLPGFSRSGLTVSSLLLRKFDDVFSLRLSFLMSIPVVIGANLVFALKDGIVMPSGIWWGVACAFVIGLATIHVLLKFASKVRFGAFMIIFGVLVLLSTIF